MRIVGLISGGKDSIFNMLQCIAAGHEIVAVANVEPNSQTDEMDSYMYQTVGHQALSLVSAALSLPIYRQKTKAQAICKEKFYVVTPDDEVEDLYALISKVKEDMHIEGVSVGAIASDYQRTRVENVCSRLNLKCFAYLWRRDQQELLSEMIASELEVIIIKVAALGLKPEVHLGATITDLQSTLIRLSEKFGINVCGEGGEYETLTLDCPLYHRRIKILDSKKVIHSDDAFAPVGYLSITNATLENKMWDNEDTVPSLQARLDYIRNIVNPPLYYVQDCLTENTDKILRGPSRVSEVLPTSSKIPLGQEESIIGHLDLWKSRQSLQQSRSQSSPSYTLTFSPSLVVGVDTAVVQLNHSTGWCCIGNITAPDVKEGLNILRKHLERCRYELRDLVAISLYIRDMNDWPRINKVYSNIIPSHCPPTRVCTAVPLGNDMGVILTAVAHRLVSRTQKIIHHTLHTVDRDYVNVQSISHWAPACLGPYSQCIRIGEIVYVAGQIPLVPGSMELLPSSVYDQCRLTLRHVQRILQAVNESYTLSNVMFGICYVSSEEIAPDIMSLWNSITKNEHAPIAVVVAQSLPKYAQLEWQILACGYEGQRVSHTTEKISDDFEVVYKRCVYVDHNTASLVCNMSYTKKTKKRDKDGGMLTPAHLLTLMKQCLHRLRGDITGSGTPLCIFNVFFKATELAVAHVINETMKGCLDFKVVISSIPVIACNQQDVFLTITGVCH